MERFTRWTMIAGFTVALVALWVGQFGSLPVVYAVLILLTGTFALWGLRRR